MWREGRKEGEPRASLPLRISSVYTSEAELPRGQHQEEEKEGKKKKKETVTLALLTSTLLFPLELLSQGGWKKGKKKGGRKEESVIIHRAARLCRARISIRRGEKRKRWEKKGPLTSTFYSLLSLVLFCTALPRKEKGEQGKEKRRDRLPADYSSDIVRPARRQARTRMNSSAKTTEGGGGGEKGKGGVVVDFRVPFFAPIISRAADRESSS